MGHHSCRFLTVGAIVSVPAQSINQSINLYRAIVQRRVLYSAVMPNQREMSW